MVLTTYPDLLDAERLRERGCDITARRIAKHFHPTAGELEAVCGSSLRSATFPRLTGGLFGQPLNDVGRDHPERCAVPTSLITFIHAHTDNAEAHENNGA